MLRIIQSPRILHTSQLSNALIAISSPTDDNNIDNRSFRTSIFLIPKSVFFFFHFRNFSYEFLGGGSSPSRLNLSPPPKQNNSCMSAIPDFQSNQTNPEVAFHVERSCTKLLELRRPIPISHVAVPFSCQDRPIGSDRAVR